MKRRRYVQALVALILVLWLPAMATGSKLAGTWKSTNGETISIPDTPNDFDLVFKHGDGTKALFPAHWTKGMVGTQFWYVNKRGVRFTGLYNRAKDQVRVDNGKAENWWVRLN